MPSDDEFDDAEGEEELPPGKVSEPAEEPPTELHQWQTKYELLRTRYERLKADRGRFVAKVGKLAKKVEIQDQFLSVEGSSGKSRGRQVEILQTELERSSKENALLKRKLSRARMQAASAAFAS